MFMKESQNTEWKESWRDEYLKWICGFANAQGGRIYIGTNDDGTVIGVLDSKKLLEDIPNKVRELDEAIKRKRNYAEQLIMLRFIQKDN